MSKKRHRISEKINTTSYCKDSRLLKVRNRILFGLYKREELESLAMRYKEGEIISEIGF